MSFSEMRFSRILSSVLVLSASVATPSQSSIYFSGMYGSLSVGGAYLSSNPKVNTPTGQNSASIAKMSPAVGGSLGFMTEVGVSTWIVGAEVFAHKTFADFKRGVGSGSSGQTIQINRQLGYGPALMAGKLLNPKSAVYVRGGFELSKHSNHVVFGGGLRYAYSDRLHMGVEYGIAVIANKEIRKTSVAVADKSKIQAKMTEHRLMFKVSYQFTSSLVSRDISPQEPHKPN